MATYERLAELMIVESSIYKRVGYVINLVINLFFLLFNELVSYPDILAAFYEY